VLRRRGRKIYQAMKPEEAAPIFDLDDSTAMTIFSCMKEKQSAHPRRHEPRSRRRALADSWPARRNLLGNPRAAALPPGRGYARDARARATAPNGGAAVAPPLLPRARRA
jgi:hypothetical protein